MSNPNPSEKSINFSPPEVMSAEWVAAPTPADCTVTNATVTGTNLVQFKGGPGLDYDPEELEATDAIAFNFFPVFNSPRLSTPSPTPIRRNLFDALLTPWSLGGCFCLLLANSLLTFSAINNPPIPAAVSPPLNPVAVKPQTSLLNLSSPPSQKLNLTTLSQLSDPLVSQAAVTPAYRIAAPLNTTQSSSPAIATQTVSAPPVVRESLTELLLPPSLQPQYRYSVALPPVAPQTINQGVTRMQPRQFSPVAANPRPIQLAPVTVQPPSNLPTIAVPPSYTRQAPPQGTVFPQSNPNSIPFSPPIGSGLAPTGMNPPVGTQTNPVSMPNSNAASPDGSSSQPTASEQIEQQILSQQRQLQLSQQQAGNFNQTMQPNLRSLSNQNQELPTTPTDSKTKELVEQLQQLNQPE